MSAPPLARLLYLAVADARGHLMRAHLVRQLLARDGVSVDVVTTTVAGQAFLAQLGTPSCRISDGFRIVFGSDHRLSAGRTERRVLRYLLGRQARHDLTVLERLSQGTRLLVVDSLHPAVLAAPLLGGLDLPVVHVYGANLLAATREHACRRLPRRLASWFSAQLDQALGRAVGSVVHALETGASDVPSDGRVVTLPPLLAAPRRGRSSVRAALRLGPAERLAAVYLNPHLEDPRLARLLEETLAEAGYHLHGVSEPFAGRPGWTATDAAFTDVAAASDLVVSGAGMAACGLVQACRVPFLTLLGAQPEQQRNLLDLEAAWRPGDPGLEAVSLAAGPGALGPALRSALERLAASRPAGAPRAAAGFAATEERWRQTFHDLMARAATAASDPHPRPRRITHEAVAHPPR